jgi:serine/threonine protein kinase
MEYADEGSLAAKIRTTNSTTKKQKLAIARGLVEGLLQMHSHGIVHRDLNPSHILLFADAEKNMIPKISDFGTANQVNKC